MENPTNQIEEFVAVMEGAIEDNNKIAVTFKGNGGDIITYIISIENVYELNGDIVVEGLAPNGRIKLKGISSIEDCGIFDGWIIRTNSGEWSFYVMD